MEREALLQALTSPEAERRFSDEELKKLMDAEFAKPEEEIDCEILDACCLLLERRQSPFTERQLARSERRRFRQFKRWMKQNGERRTAYRPAFLKPVAAVLLVLALIFLPALSLRQSFKTAMPSDEQQYLVIGLQQDDAGIAQALAARKVETRTVHLERLEEIPPLLGYQIAWPAWLPDGCELSDIDVVQTSQYDGVTVRFHDTREQGKQIVVALMCFADRSGVATSYEQDEEGQIFPLENGVSIYVAHNVQSVWGLYQTEHLDYYIEATGYDEDVIPRLFCSIESNVD